MTAQEGPQGYVDVIARLGVRNVPPGGEATMPEVLALIPPDARRIVDLGCNTGWSTAEIARARPDAEVTGIDLSPAMVGKARLKHRRPNLTFEEGDAAALDRRPSRVDAAVCAGSSAFFADVPGTYAAVGSALSPDGVFVNAHYVYDAAAPADLHRREQEAFGVRPPCRSAAECVAEYELAGLVLDTYAALPRRALPDTPAGALYRSVLRSVPGVGEAVDYLRARRELARELAPFRTPVVVSARTAPGRPPTDVLTTAEIVEVMDLFRLPLSPLPMARLRRMLPYEFLAYLGDPDTAPGGAASVRRAARLLAGFGLTPQAAVLDVGSFTGMSTFALARSFPRVLGIDVEPVFLGASQLLAAALGSPARFELMDARHLTLAAGSQDAVVMTATLGYTPDPLELIAEAFRVLRPGGFFVEFFYHHHVRTPDQQALARASVGPDLRLRALSEQLADVEAAGFGVRTVRRLEPPGMSDAALDAVCAALVERERAWNPLLDGAEVAEFAELVERYAGRGFPPAVRPDVYLCVFQRPAG